MTCDAPIDYPCHPSRFPPRWKFDRGYPHPFLSGISSEGVCGVRGCPPNPRQVWQITRKFSFGQSESFLRALSARVHLHHIMTECVLRFQIWLSNWSNIFWKSIFSQQYILLYFGTNVLSHGTIAYITSIVPVSNHPKKASCLLWQTVRICRDSHY